MKGVSCHVTWNLVEMIFVAYVEPMVLWQSAPSDGIWCMFHVACSFGDGLAMLYCPQNLLSPPPTSHLDPSVAIFIRQWRNTVGLNVLYLS